MRPSRSIPGPLLLEVQKLTDLSAEAVSEVEQGAGKDSGIDPAMLADYLPAVLRAARSGRSIEERELDRFRRIGEDAAEKGVPLSALLDLYLSAGWRLWRAIHDAARMAGSEAVAAVADSLLRSSDDTAQALGRGFQEGQRLAIRREEAVRREFVDALLSGTGNLEWLQEWADGFGFTLPAAHRIVVAETDPRMEEGSTPHAMAESRIMREFGGTDVLVATRDGDLVCALSPSEEDAAQRIADVLDEIGLTGWRLGVGSEEPGVGGVARSYRQARESLAIAGALGSTSKIVWFDSLLAYHLLLRDRAALEEVVEDVLGGLDGARGGPEVLLQTMEAFFASSGNLSAAARQLHVSPRAVSYRLQAITRLTGRRPQAPDDRFLLELAVRAARLTGRFA